jgi:hypothetical protein
MQTQTIEAPSHECVARGVTLRTRWCESLDGQLPAMARSSATITIRPRAQQRIGRTPQHAKLGCPAMRPRVFQLTPGARHDACAGPGHRCHQNATIGSHSGDLDDLFARIEVTNDAASSRQHEPAGSTDEGTDVGESSLRCTNVRQGHAPYFKCLAAHDRIGDNSRQPGDRRHRG